MQLVGCTPTSGLWGLWNNHFTVLFVTAGQQSYTDSAESLRRTPVACNIHSCPPGVLLKNYHCTILWSVPAWRYFMFIQPHFCLGVSRVSVHILTCRCVYVKSLPLYLHLFLTGKPQADWIGYTPLFLLHHPSPALFLSLPLVPPFNGTKALLGMAWHLLAHFESSSFYVESFEKVRFLFYLFINFNHFLGYPKEYLFDITSNGSLLLFLSFCWDPPQPQAATERQAEQHAQTVLTYPCPSSTYEGDFFHICAWDGGTVTVNRQEGFCLKRYLAAHQRKTYDTTVLEMIVNLCMEKSLTL